MILKVRSLGKGFSLPTPREECGFQVFNEKMVGKVYRIREEERDLYERVCGELSMSVFPMAVDLQLDAPNDGLNGLWAQEGALRQVEKNLARS